jgi:hypothetical protein
MYRVLYIHKSTGTLHFKAKYRHNIQTTSNVILNLCTQNVTHTKDVVVRIIQLY